VRALISFVAVAVAVVCQLTMVDRIAFPGGAGPDLVLVLVAALALASGPLVGSLTGFWGGLALDVAPPGSHFTGQNALVFCLVGYSCGLLADAPSGDGAAEPGHTALFEIVVTAVGAICGEALVALLGVMLSDPRVTWPAITHVLPAAAAYDAVACPFVLYAAAAALRLAGRRRGEGASWSAASARTPKVPPLAQLGGSHGGAAGGISAPRREPRLKLGRGLGAGAALAAGSSVAGPVKVRFTSRRRQGVLGGSLLGGAPRGGNPAGSGLARTGIGRSLLGGSVFSRSSPALARTGRTAMAGGTVVPRFSRGRALSRLTGALRRSARPRSPGRGWLRRSPGEGWLRRASTSGTFGTTALRRRAGLRTGGPARLRMPRRSLAKRSWRTGGYR
jgi:rod shape-determining protein MreD